MITSAQNSKVKWIRQLLASSDFRKENNLCVIEGIRLAEEALNANYLPHLVLFCQPISHRGQILLDRLVAKNVDVQEVQPDLLNRISDTRQSQGIIMAFPMIPFHTATNLTKLLVLDCMRDPGNMGTIFRSAAAMDFHSVILTPGCVDPYAPKVLRAGMGAHFRITINTMEPQTIKDFCKNVNTSILSIFLADPKKGKTCWECDLVQPLCLIIGGEASGASTDFQAMADDFIHIPMHPTSESLNAAISAAILMYETNRQRNMK